MRPKPEEATVARSAVARPAAGEAVEPFAAEPARLGRYDVLFQLARGGMGTVHVARLRGAHGFGRLVAIKRLSLTGATEEEKAALLAEARLTARLSHPNVVQTLDLGEHDGLPFIVMQLVPGVSLARLLRHLAGADDALEPELAAWIAAQIATGLHAAHELDDGAGVPLGLVHRDVSPENVLLSWEGRVYVADFGVAKLAGQDRATKSGVVKGKFAYMSPEQTRAAPLDRRSDVFSLGIVLHECLTGRRLFAGESPADTIRRVVELVPPDPSSLRPDVPEPIAAIAMRCLEKRPDDRYATAAEVADALRRVLRDARAVVDEGDVAQLLERCFAEEKRQLSERLRTAARGPAGEKTDGKASALGGGAGDDGSISVAGRSSEHGSVTAAIGSAPARSRRFAGTTFVVLAGAAIAAGAWMLRSGAGPAPVADVAAASQPAPPASVPAPGPEPAPTELPAASPPAASAPTPALPEARASSSKVRPGSPPRSPDRAPRPPAPSASHPAQPAAPPPAPSHGGVPFRDL